MILNGFNLILILILINLGMIVGSNNFFWTFSNSISKVKINQSLSFTQLDLVF